MRPQRREFARILARIDPRDDGPDGPKCSWSSASIEAPPSMRSMAVRMCARASFTIVRNWPSTRSSQQLRPSKFASSISCSVQVNPMLGVSASLENRLRCACSAGCAPPDCCSTCVSSWASRRRPSPCDGRYCPASKTTWCPSVNALAPTDRAAAAATGPSWIRTAPRSWPKPCSMKVRTCGSSGLAGEESASPTIGGATEARAPLESTRPNRGNSGVATSGRLTTAGDACMICSATRSACRSNGSPGSLMRRPDAAAC